MRPSPRLPALLLLAAASLAAGCITDVDADLDADDGASVDASAPGADISLHTGLGLPSPASKRDSDDFLSVKAEYALSYNASRKVPNWVSWHLDAADLGTQDRQNDFRRDDTLPARLAQATLADYRGSGFDRGHMCPSGDRTASEDANSETFLLSNMVPQAGNNNRGPWEDLESYSRDLVEGGQQLFIVAGPVFRGRDEAIGRGVAVPDQTFKVIVVLDAADGDGPADVTRATRVIGVMIPNDDAKVAQSDDWEQFRVPVRTIEDATGLDFLSEVDPRVQDAVERRADAR